MTDALTRQLNRAYQQQSRQRRRRGLMQIRIDVNEADLLAHLVEQGLVSPGERLGRAQLQSLAGILVTRLLVRS